MRQDAPCLRFSDDGWVPASDVIPQEPSLPAAWGSLRHGNLLHLELIQTLRQKMGTLQNVQ